MKPVAMIFGASRGIGANIAQKLSGSHIVVIIGKTTSRENPKMLPGTINQVASQISDAFPIQCNVVSEEEIKNAVDIVMNRYGRIDVIVYNAGAIMWNSVENTTIKQFDLMHNVNSRGLYCTVQYVLPIFKNQQSGRFIVVSPPIYSRFCNNKTPYAMTKIAMSILALGLSKELPPSIAITCLWPATAIKTYVTSVLNIPDEKQRTPDIFSDCVIEVLSSKVEDVNGKCLLDEDFLRSKGHNDFVKYRCNPKVEPPRMMPRKFPVLLVDEELELAKL